MSKLHETRKNFTPSGVIRLAGGEASEKPDASGFSLY
jgi:hypothetical protein